MPINASAVLSDGEARHLLRRTGFGATPLEFATVRGKTRGAAADQLLAFKPKAFKPSANDFRVAHDKWIKYMLVTKAPLQQKLALFWHDHFSVANSKVEYVKSMADYVGLLHLYAKGNFRAFLKAMNKNAAMMEFLDTERNSDDQPNENYARELMELFTLGVHDFTPSAAPNYTQADIVQIARAFTGWRYDYRSRKSYFDDYAHDYVADWPDRGAKTIFQSTGGFGAAGRAFDDDGEGPQEIDRVIDILLDHRDTEGNVTTARRIAYRLCEFLAHPNPSLTFADDIVADSGFATTWDIGGLVRSLLTHDDFFLTAAGPPYTAGSKKSVRWPIDYAVTALRLLGVKPAGRYFQVQGGDYRSMIDYLTDMGQILMDPPSVFGWDWETGWVSSATLLARAGFARDVTSARYGSSKFRPDRYVDLSLTDPGDIVDAVTDVLGVTDQLSPQERQVLVDYLTDDGANAALDLHDYDVRNTKLNGLFALVLESPAFQLI